MSGIIVLSIKLTGRDFIPVKRVRNSVRGSCDPVKTSRAGDSHSGHRMSTRGHFVHNGTSGCVHPFVRGAGFDVEAGSRDSDAISVRDRRLCGSDAALLATGPATRYASLAAHVHCPEKGEISSSSLSLL